MEFYDFPIILGIMIPIDELIFLRGVETTNQILIWDDTESVELLKFEKSLDLE
jgi:hypothetical protein